MCNLKIESITNSRVPPQLSPVLLNDFPLVVDLIQLTAIAIYFFPEYNIK
jgi:hypothetical protein